jgi:hypothetical protein
MQRFASEVNSSPDLKALPKDRVGHATSLLVDNNKGKRQEKKKIRARARWYLSRSLQCNSCFKKDVQNEWKTSVFESRPIVWT